MTCAAFKPNAIHAANIHPPAVFDEFTAGHLPTKCVHKIKLEIYSAVYNKIKINFRSLTKHPILKTR